MKPGLRLAPILLAVLFGAAPAHAAPTAREFLQTIYSHYIGKKARGVSLENETEIRRYLAPPLADAILADRAEAHGEVGSVDSDIFVDAQDFAIKRVDITTDEADHAEADHATGVARFVNHTRPVTITLDLVRASAEWRIADIKYADYTLSQLAGPHLILGGDLPNKDELTIAELQKLGPVTMNWNAHGERHQVLGVRLDRVLTARGFAKGETGKEVPPAQKRAGYKKVVLATAADEYQAVLSCAEITEGMGNTVALLVWQIDGQLLDRRKGPVRLVVTTDGEPSRSIYALRGLEVLDVPALDK